MHFNLTINILNNASFVIPIPDQQIKIHECGSILLTKYD